MNTIIVDKLDGIKPHFQRDVFEAMKSLDNKERLLVCLYFMSDLSDDYHHLDEIETNFRKIFPPSVRGHKTPDDYADFQATLIRNPFNAETSKVRVGQLRPEDCLWRKPSRGCWRNTALGNQQAIRILRRQHLVVRRLGAAPPENDLTEEEAGEYTETVEDVTLGQLETDASPSGDFSPKNRTTNSRKVFTILLEDIKAALQESLARSNVATRQGDFDTAEVELERQKILVGARNQLEVLQELWPSLIEASHSTPCVKQHPVFARYKGRHFEAILLPDHCILWNGEKYSSPSSAAKAITGGKSVNGWRFWRYLDDKGNEQLIDTLR
jgi:hypothetical protein